MARVTRLESSRTASAVNPTRKGEIMSSVDEGDYILHKKVSELTLTQVKEQLQMLEYSELNSPESLTDADLKFRQ